MRRFMIILFIALTAVAGCVFDSDDGDTKKTFTVSGKVTTDVSTDDYRIYLTNADFDTAGVPYDQIYSRSVVDSAFIEPDGNYSISDVDPGSYKLLVVPPQDSMFVKVETNDSNPFTVDDSDVTCDFTITKDLQGMIIEQGSFSADVYIVNVPDEEEVTLSAVYIDQYMWAAFIPFWCPMTIWEYPDPNAVPYDNEYTIGPLGYEFEKGELLVFYTLENRWRVTVVFKKTDGETFIKSFTFWEMVATYSYPKQVTMDYQTGMVTKEY